MTVGTQVLLYFAILLGLLALAVCFARRSGRHRAFAVLGAVWVVIVDRHVKQLIVAHLALGGTAPLLPGLFRLERVHNYGAAWSSFSGARWLLVAVTAAALLALGFLAVKRVKRPLGVWALWLIIGGGAGNLVDRVARGYVVDMIAAEFVDFPVFNIADIFVTCGAAAAAVYYWKDWEKADGTGRPDNGTGAE